MGFVGLWMSKRDRGREKLRVLLELSGVLWVVSVLEKMVQ